MKPFTRSQILYLNSYSIYIDKSLFKKPFYEDKEYWKTISHISSLSESFIREFKDYLDWKAISLHNNLSKSFIEEFKDYLDFDYIAINKKANKERYIKNKKK